MDTLIRLKGSPIISGLIRRMSLNSLNKVVETSSAFLLFLANLFSNYSNKKNRKNLMPKLDFAKSAFRYGGPVTFLFKMSASEVGGTSLEDVSILLSYILMKLVSTFFLT